MTKKQTLKNERMQKENEYIVCRGVKTLPFITKPPHCCRSPLVNFATTVDSRLILLRRRVHGILKENSKLHNPSIKCICRANNLIYFGDIEEVRTFLQLLILNIKVYIRFIVFLQISLCFFICRQVCWIRGLCISFLSACFSFAVGGEFEGWGVRV